MTKRIHRYIQALAATGLALVVLAATPPGASASDHPTPAGASSELLRQSVALRTIDPRDEDFADLEPLREVLRSRRVVILGEATHGEGSAFLAKTRLAKFLHRELGFDVLAWETGMYDARCAWRALRAGEEPLAALRLGLVPVWSESEQIRELGEYLARTASGPRPLELVGFDTHVAAVVRADEVRLKLLGELERMNATLGELAAPASALASLEALTKPERRTPQNVARAIRVLEGLRDGLARSTFGDAIGAPEVSWWRQALDTWIHKVRTVDGITGNWLPGAPMAPFFNPRDSRLGENLIWLARERYPDRKIVVWTATMHAVRRPEVIDASEIQVDYADVVPMGHHAAIALGSELYVLGFVAGSGETHLPWLPASEIEPAPAGSFEAIARDAGLDNAWIDLAGAPERSWLRGSFRARPLGHQPMTGVWSEVLDGLFFTRRATPSGRRSEGAPPPQPTQESRPLPPRP